MSRRLVAGAALLLSTLILHPGLAQTPDGWNVGTQPLAVTSFVGGFELLPGGDHAVFDGAAVVTVDPSTGMTTGTLFTPPTGTIFGAFLRIAPNGLHLYFGESQFGDVWEIPLGVGMPRVVTNVPFPYDMTFDSTGAALLSWSPGFGQGSVVSLVDLGTGALDDLIVSTESSGPLGVAPDGRIVYLRPDTSAFPPPANTSRLLRFTPAQIQSAFGAGTLDDLLDGELLAFLDGGFGLAVDGEGDVFVSDSVNDVVVEVDGESGAETVLFSGGASFLGETYVRFHAGTAGAFAAYQPATAGTLITLRSDFFSFNEILTFTPARPGLTTSIPSPIPFGFFSVELTGGVPAGAAWMLIGFGGVTAGETPHANPTAEGPLLIGLDGPYLVLPFALDAAGEATLPAFSPGISWGFGLQTIVGETFGGAFPGTSNPLDVQF